MWSSEVRKHRKILAGAELITQALRFFGPDFSKTRPKRLNKIHLVAVFDNAAAQVMQVLGL